MPDADLIPGDHFKLSCSFGNATSSDAIVHEYVALELHDLYWFWPDWTPGAASILMRLWSGQSNTDEIFNFDWPRVSGSQSDLVFWAALLDASSGKLLALDSIGWNYHE
jgi:hypothetical protein